MALTVTRADVWAATVEDRAGGAAEKLEALAAGGANLEMLLARRTEQALGAKIARTLGAAGINFRGISAVAIGRKFLSYVACDTPEDAAKAVSALKKMK